MATVKLNVGMASIFFRTDLEKNLTIFDNPYLVLSASQLTKSLLSEILMRIYNSEHPKSFLGVMPKQSEKEAIEKLLEALIDERKVPYALLGSNRPILFFAKGIEKQCLYSMKILKMRMLSSLAAINFRQDYEKAFELIKAADEIKGLEIYRDTIMIIYRPSKVRVAIGKSKTILISEDNFRTLLSENPDIITPVQVFPAGDKHLIIEEGAHDG